jgi:hypothetical protein
LLAHGRWFSPGTPASSTTKNSSTPKITRITIIKYAQNRKLGKSTSLKVIWSKTTKGHKQDNQSRIKSPMPEDLRYLMKVNLVILGVLDDGYSGYFGRT